jgi:hypothetical protein
VTERQFQQQIIDTARLLGWKVFHPFRQAGRWRDGDGVYYSATVTDWNNLP